MNKHKYKAERTKIGDKSFASKKEARRYQELLLLQKLGKIKDLKTQVRYPLIVTMHYVADFVYEEDGAIVTEDVKGYRTREYIRKKKEMLKQHGVVIRET